MKVEQLRKVLCEVADQREAAGDIKMARSLKQFAKLAEKHDPKTVTTFAKLLKADS